MNRAALARLATLLLALAGSASPVRAQDHAHHLAGDAPETANERCDDTSLRCARSATPALGPDGRLWLAWTAAGVVSVADSADGGQHFGPPRPLAPPDSRLDTGPDARAQIAVTRSGTVVVVWATFKDQAWNARLHLSRSTDGGAHFLQAIEPVTNPASARFPTLVAAGADEIYLAWLDKRLVAANRRGGSVVDGASLAWARSVDGGARFGEVRIGAAASCECCRIALALPPQTTDKTAAQRPVMVLRGLLPGSIRDHIRVAFTSAEATGPASLVAADRWATRVCPHQGPALAIDEAGNEHAAWYTAGSTRQGLFYARTVADKPSDAGAGQVEFALPESIGEMAEHPSRPALLAIGSTVWRVWKALNAGQTVIRAQASIDLGKHWGPVRAVASTHGYSDHPMLLAIGGRATLSWLTRQEGYRLIDLEASP